MFISLSLTRLLCAARLAAPIAPVVLLVLLGCKPGWAQEAASLPDALSPETMIVVVGAAGSEDFEGEFEAWGESWLGLAENNGWESTMIHEPSNGTTAHEQLRSAIEDHQSQSSRLWVVLLGHGTHANGVAKFNLTGPDVASSELNKWLQPISGEVIVVNCSSASAPFLPELSGPNRIVLTATRSGSEINYARFGDYLAQSINDPAADLDHDDSVSLLEAFLAASAKTEGFYRDEARLPTEHALLDDNQDRTGTSGDFYRGNQPIKTGKDGKPIDGQRAARVILFSSPAATQFPPHLARQRDAVELAIDQLRSEKSTRTADDYYNELEVLVLKLASLYDQAEKIGLEQ